MRLSYVLLLAVLVLLSECSDQVVNQTWSVISPNGNLGVDITSDQKTGQLFYSAFLVSAADTITLVDRSILGIELENQSFTTRLSFVESATEVWSTSYTVPAGKRCSNTATANQLKLTFTNANRNSIHIIFRVFDDGVAFQYVFPDVSEKVTVVKESTQFNLASGGKAWMQPYDTVTRWTPAYELYYEQAEVGSKSPKAGGWSFPALFQIQDNYIMLTESGLSESYFGSHLKNTQKIYSIALPDSAEAAYSGIRGANANEPFHTPWRIILMADDLSGIVQSNLVFHVADNAIGDFSWVKPGRASWSWWSDPDSPRQFKELQKFVDLSSQLGWEYTLVDANWNTMEGGTLEELARYANAKKVGLLVWYNSGGPHNDVTEQPRDRMLDSVIRRKEMQWLSSMGVKGIKVDFFQSDKQHIIGQYLGILKDAADYKLLVNFHGCTIPRGWQKTWPNLLTMEAVRGAETYSSPEFPGRAPAHNVNLVFTRNVIGSMDYTPVTFSHARQPHITTNGHELALAVVYESGIQHFADGHASYLQQSKEVKDFISKIPVSWDEVKLLKGYPGDEVMLARRKGEDWFVGYIQGTSNPREVEVPFSFLPTGEYTYKLLADGDQSAEVSVTSGIVKAPDKITVRTLAHGGFAIQLKQK